jgi:hypothetical protein
MTKHYPRRQRQQKYEAQQLPKDKGWYCIL